MYGAALLVMHADGVGVANGLAHAPCTLHHAPSPSFHVRQKQAVLWTLFVLLGSGGPDVSGHCNQSTERQNHARDETRNLRARAVQNTTTALN
jgi:hypothetical protein